MRLIDDLARDAHLERAASGTSPASASSASRRPTGTNCVHCCSPSPARARGPGGEVIREVRDWGGAPSCASGLVPVPPLLLDRSRGVPPRRPRCVEVEGLKAGAVAYQDRSFGRDPDELLEELQAEALDLAGWGFVLWCRIEAMRGALRAAGRPEPTEPGET